MPVAQLRIPPEPEHVRTVRLVAGAAARRLGLPEEVLDEVRLAVGEATARTVIRHQLAAPDRDVVIEIRDGDGNFTIVVHDTTPADETNTDDDMALAVIDAIVPTSTLIVEGSGSILRMQWPAESPE